MMTTPSGGRRPGVVVMLPDKGAAVVAVAVSTKARPGEPDLIALPNKQDNPTTTSGLPKRCRAVPRWYLLVERSRLTELVGYISGSTLRTLLAAVKLRIEKEGFE
jgi:hypothetical protein